MAWTTYLIVRERGKQFTDVPGWTETEIDKRIARAVTHLKSIWTTVYGAEEVKTWDTTTPELIAALCADLAVVFIMKDAYGEAQLSKGSPGGDFRADLDDAIEDIIQGRREVLDANGDPIARYRNRLGTTTALREPTFHSRGKLQRSREPSDLDGY